METLDNTVMCVCVKVWMVVSKGQSVLLAGRHTPDRVITIIRDQTVRSDTKEKELRQ